MNAKATARATLAVDMPATIDRSQNNSRISVRAAFHIEGPMLFPKIAERYASVGRRNNRWN